MSPIRKCFVACANWWHLSEFSTTHSVKLHWSRFFSNSPSSSSIGDQCDPLLCAYSFVCIANRHALSAHKPTTINESARVSKSAPLSALSLRDTFCERVTQNCAAKQCQLCARARVIRSKKKRQRRKFIHRLSDARRVSVRCSYLFVALV